MKKKSPLFQAVLLSALLGAALSAAGCSLPRSAQTERTEQALDEVLDAYENRYADLAELSLRHDADMEQFRDVIAGLEETRLDVQGAWLDSRFRLKKHLTRTEWESIYGGR
jgi:hypothetical protein